MPTHDDFFEMAEAIFEAASFEGFSIVPYERPDTLEVGFMAALPASRRGPQHQWSVSLDEVHRARSDPRWELTRQRLWVLQERPPAVPQGLTQAENSLRESIRDSVDEETLNTFQAVNRTLRTRWHESVYPLVVKRIIEERPDLEPSKSDVFGGILRGLIIQFDEEHKDLPSADRGSVPIAKDYIRLCTEELGIEKPKTLWEHLVGDSDD